MNNVTQTKGRIVSDKVQRTGMPIPEIGRIKIGEKILSRNNKEIPSSLDYFRATGPFATQFHEQFGAKPTKILIVFISDNFSDSCNEEYACWENGKRYGWGDGEIMNVYDPSIKDYRTVSKDDPLLKGKKWDIMLTLRFVIPEMRGILGHWVFTTKGAKTTIPSIVKAFDFVKERVGTVVGVPFELSVERAKGYNPGEARQYSRVKLVPVISEQYMTKVKEMLKSGVNITDIAPIMVSEAKLLNEAEIAKLPAAIDIEASSVDDIEEEENKNKNPKDLFDDGTI